MFHVEHFKVEKIKKWCYTETQVTVIKYNEKIINWKEECNPIIHNNVIRQ